MPQTGLHDGFSASLLGPSGREIGHADIDSRGMVDRLDFLRLACATPLLGLRSADSRLTARPRTPFRPVEAGASRIAPALERGGVLYVPAAHGADTPSPLIVALHGAGGRADTWSRLFSTCEANGIVLLAPDARARTWDRVTSDFGPDVGFIDAALRYTFERCAIDPAHIAIAGFSDGTSYALSLGPSNGDLFTHIMAWSPGFSNPADPIVGRPKIFVSHGTSDRVLPVAASRVGIVPMFEMDGYAIEYVEFEGAHEMPEGVISTAIDWFLE